jgi:Alr-MurF fusion protein
MHSSSSRPTYVQVSLDAIRSNLSTMKTISNTQVMAVVKANAYGHGSVEIARAAGEAGADWFGVAFTGEGIALRKAGISGKILVMGYTPPDLAGEAIQHDLSLAVYNPLLAGEYSKTASALRRNAHLHIKVETGMGRLGLPPLEAADLAQGINKMKGAHLEGLFTHFASADEADLTFAREQLSLFQGVVEKLEAEGIHPDVIHAANSAAGLRLPEARFDLLRMGIALYGLHPSKDTLLPSGFLPALAWKTQVSQVKWIERGISISYGRTYFTRSQEQVAVLPVGYADGFRRSPPSESQVLINGQRVPVVGRVCMDQTMVDATLAGEIRIGDEVVIIGRQGEANISAEDVAEWWGTINYEVVSGIMARVPRIYKEGKQA